MHTHVQLRHQNQSVAKDKSIQLATRNFLPRKIITCMEKIGILPRYNIMQRQLQSMLGTY